MVRGVIFGKFQLLHEGHKSLIRFANTIVDELIIYCVTERGKCHKRKNEIEAIPGVHFCVSGPLDVVDFVRNNDIQFVFSGDKYDPVVSPELKASLKQFCKVIDAPFLQIPSSPGHFREASFKHDESYLEKYPGLINKIDKLLNNIQIKDILVIGDLIIDIFEECEGVGMSRETPTLVVKPLKTEIYFGGAGIVAAHLNSFASRTSFISSVGDCENVKKFANEANNIRLHTFLYKNKQNKTVTKKRICLNGFPVLRINDFPSAFEDEDYLRYVDTVISKNNFDLVIFSDFNYGAITPNIYTGIMDRIQSEDCIVVADSQSSSQVGKIEIFEGVNLICMTEYEARLALKEYAAPLNRLADMVLNKFNKISFCILKLGEHGMIVSERNANGIYTQEHIQALNTDPFDTSGAGDALLVGTSIGLAHKLSIFESAYLGAMFAAIQCSRRGNVAVKPQEIIKFSR